MPAAIAIFVKTPGHSRVKTRLAAVCGKAYAKHWHTLAAAAVASVVKQAAERCSCEAYWAVAEKEAIDAWPGLPVLLQGEDGLGTRMARVQQQLVARHGGGILLGADAPQLDADLLTTAIEWLDAQLPRFALGPADDGGFWLFGGNRAPSTSLWESVRYSVADTAQALHRAMQSLGEWRVLPPLTDVDTAHDLAAVAGALDALPRATVAQQALRDWMRAQPAHVA